jgi:hypothetical protein
VPSPPDTPRDKLRLHFQLLKLAPSGLNPPYFLLPLSEL